MYFLLVYSTSLLYTSVFVWNINLFFWLTIAITYFFLCCFLVVVSDSLWSQSGLYPIRLLSPRKQFWSGLRISFPTGSSLTQRIEPPVCHTEGRFCITEPPGKSGDLYFLCHWNYHFKGFWKTRCNIKLLIFKNLWVFKQINGHEIYFMTTRKIYVIFSKRFEVKYSK